MRTPQTPAATGGERFPLDPENRLNSRRHRYHWSPWITACVFGAVLAMALWLSGIAAPEIASLAALTDYEGWDNAFLGLLFGQAAVVVALLARGRAAIRRQRQLIASALGLLAIASLLFGARGAIFMLLVELAMLASFPRKGRY